MAKKKPNYKLRRNLAKFFLILIILIPIILINKTKILNAPLYMSNYKYAKILDAMFEIEYTNNEARDTLNYLIKEKKISNHTSNYILKINNMGYSNNVVNYVVKNLNKDQTTDFLSRKYNKDFEKYIKCQLFDYKHYDRYLKYQKKHDKLSIDDIVTRIALNMDMVHYEDSEFIKDPNRIDTLANKYYEISDEYEPSDLVDMDDKYANNTYGKKRLRKEAYDKFVEMCEAAKKDKVKFYAESAYRSYDHQNLIYKNYVNENGADMALKYAAKPGFSEHELGLALDIANVWTIKTDGKEYKWIDKNAHKYGYIIRYKKEWEEVTGYAAESWHIRYVGVKNATAVHKLNVPYEEYYIKNIANKK